MKQRTLGRHGLTVSALGLGCMGLSQGYGAADDTESITTLHRAIEAGITFLDTAISYGIGHNERLLGRALAGRREEVTLATKFGIVRGPDGVQLDGRPDHVQRYCDASLARSASTPSTCTTCTALTRRYRSPRPSAPWPS